MQELELNTLSESNQSTVVYEYKPDRTRQESYQSEQQLEDEVIKLLEKQGYTYLAIKSEKDLIDNLRKQLELVNNYDFTDNEWDRFFKNSIANGQDGTYSDIQTPHLSA